MDRTLLDFISRIYELIGWPGVVVLMAIESAAIPLPSEIIMPLAGWFLIQSHGLGPWWLLLAALLGAAGNTLGSIATYWIGAVGGRPLLERYGRYVLLREHELDRADAWFRRYGSAAVFIGRLLPGVRTFISIPAGIARMDFALFNGLTFAGSFLWSLLLAWTGYVLGANYERVHHWMQPLEAPIAIAFLLLVAWYVYRHLQDGHTSSSGAGHA